MYRYPICLLFLCFAGTSQTLVAEQPTAYSVGVAQSDITPDYPIRLSGFGFRRAESEAVTQPIWAKALAISTVGEDLPVVLITVENLGLPASVCDEVAKRLAKKTGLPRTRLSITATHTHSAPMLRGVASTLFGGPLPDEQWQRIDRYTSELTDKLEQLAIDALKDRRPARLFWGMGSVKFAINRRTKGGPVDHDLPVLVVKSLEGKVRGIYLNYACHNVTLSDNKISGDWTGFAQDLIQRENPGAIAMMSIGCGADQNPSSGVTGDKIEIARQQGAEIAAEVQRLLSGFLAPVSGDIAANWESIELEFAEPATRAQWEEKAKKNDAVGYHARVQLERLDRGESLRSKLDYPIASWTFGDSLAMLFLPGEVVVDYSLRLKRELDGRRLWINAYANDTPCYIPSERVLSEGGYEAAGAMVYYDRPGPLKAGLEERIIAAAHRQLAPKFASPFDWKKTSGTLPKSPQQSLALLETTPNLRVDLVVSEPLIQDPVAIDFGLDGALWVAEMLDYPTGSIRTDHAPNAADDKPNYVLGRIRLVRDRDGDGQFDSSTVFLDNIPLPTGVTVWRNGVLVCSAPDILFAEDTDGDDKADVVKTLFTGFGTSNNQARVNSLCYGLDGWIHGSCGMYGGRITNFKGERYELGDRDFRMKPDTGQIEAVTGRTQQGRVRDEFGDWFGCDNTTLAFHYPLAERYLTRNPFITSPNRRVELAQSDDARTLFPARADAQRFQLSGPPGAVTAACGIGVYHDTRLGPEYHGNLFVCEPVNLLVHRLVLEPSGSSFVARRAANEMQTEFLRSTDGWFRPVQAVTGPDGALWVVDMYRFIIEDPRWIPEHELAPLDVRAGSMLGRIYRVRNAAEHSRPATRHSETTNSGATVQVASVKNANARQSPVYQELEIQQIAHRTELAGANESDDLSNSQPNDDHSSNPTWRMLHYRMRDAQGRLSTSDIVAANKDPHPCIRRFGLVLAERDFPKDRLPSCVIDAATDEDAHVRLQAAFSLGAWGNASSGEILAKLALKDAADPYLVAAVFSSVSRKNLRSFLTALFEELKGREPPPSLIPPLLATAVGYSDDVAVKQALRAFAIKDGEPPQSWQIDAVSNLVEALSHRAKPEGMDSDAKKMIMEMQGAARSIALSDSHDEDLRLAAIHLLGRDPRKINIDTQSLGLTLQALNSPAIQIAAVDALERIGSDAVPDLLASRFRAMSPGAQERAIDAFLSREAWLSDLLTEISGGTIPASAMTAAQRQEIVGHPDVAVRERAAQLLSITLGADRRKVVEQYVESAVPLKGDVRRGRDIFAKSCSQCHKLGAVGHAVGPNLAMVANKSPAFLMQEIFDPNRNVDSRYTTYTAVLDSGLTRTGILSSESATSLTLRGAEGKEFPLLRKELEELRANGKSLMPEGMEKDLSHQSAADVIAFLASTGDAADPANKNPPQDADVAEAAARILDQKLADKEREALIAKHPVKAAELVVAMTTGMPNDTKEEYRRIPWIWRVAVACGKRNQADQILALLRVSIPGQDQPLRDWQAVVIGGGIVNGIGLSGGWPRSRIEQILRDEPDLKARWQSCIALAVRMTDDEKVPTGTRYDALRIVAMEDAPAARRQLIKYLAKQFDDELQMGAISGLSDVESEEVPRVLLENLDHFNEENRVLALNALVRTDSRSQILLDAVSDGRVPKSMLSAGQKKALRESKSAPIKERAMKVLSE